MTQEKDAGQLGGHTIMLSEGRMTKE